MATLRDSAWSSDARRNPDFSSRFALAGDPDFIGASLLFSDPPEHTRLRQALGSAFSPHAVAAFRPRIDAIVAAAFAAHEPDTPLNVMEELAYPIPLAVICELLDTGEEMASVLRQETASLIGLLDPLADSASIEAALSSALVLMMELVPLVAERRMNPGNDLISKLAATEEGGLDVEEAIGMTLLLLAAGHETTANLIGNAVIALVDQPDKMRFLRQNPESIPTAVDELLRFDSPVQFAVRFATNDSIIDGNPVSAGSQVLIGLGAANRDPGAFNDPDHLDFRRPKRTAPAFRSWRPLAPERLWPELRRRRSSQE